MRSETDIYLHWFKKLKKEDLGARRFYGRSYSINKSFLKHNSSFELSLCKKLRAHNEFNPQSCSCTTTQAYRLENEFSERRSGRSQQHNFIPATSNVKQNCKKSSSFNEIMSLPGLLEHQLHLTEEHLS